MPIIDQHITEKYAIWNADTMEVMPTLPDESIDFCVYSPPFPAMFQYSNDPRDMSNVTTYEEGLEQYQFIVNEIFRLMKPGRLTAVHCMDLPKSKLTKNTFPSDIERAHIAAGFHYSCTITVWKDPWLIARRTRMKTLRHMDLCKDSAQVQVGPADYIKVFIKGGANAEPVAHPNGLNTYAGETEMPEHLVKKYSNYTGDQKKNLLSHWIWRRYASPVWMDIRTGRLMPYLESKENEEEKHVCPLQLDVIERLLTLYSNPGDKVLTPFMGVGSEVFQALEMGRFAIGTELKPSYFRQAKKNLESVGKVIPMEVGGLFDDQDEDDDEESWDDDEDDSEDDE
jgi:DNA modification methylase